MAHGEGGDNLTADLVKAQQGGAEISDHEIASVLYSLLFAGHETTTTLISNALRELLARPEQWKQLVADPKKIPAGLDEVLRYAGSIVGWRRKALKDAEVGGVPIPEGAQLLLLMGSANRDENKFDAGEDFDISRPNAREHLSFGFGIREERPRQRPEHPRRRRGGPGNTPQDDHHGQLATRLAAPEGAL